jgi:hypothetical protein
MRWPSWRIWLAGSAASQIFVPHLTEDGGRRAAAFVFRLLSSVKKGRITTCDDIAFTKPIRRLNRSSVMVSQQVFQCYDATDDTAFWHAAETDFARLIVR